jgi:MFS family permease
MRIDREVLVVLAKAAGLTGTKLDPNAADLAGKLVGVGLCLFAVAMDHLCLALVLPSIPYFVSGNGGYYHSVGEAIGLYFGAQILGNFLMVKFSNKFGRRAALVFCLAGQAVGYYLQADSEGLAKDVGMRSFEFFIITRVITGIFGGTRPLAYRYIADVTTPEEKPRFLALLNMTIALTMTAGYGLGAGLSTFTLNSAFYAAFGIMSYGFVLCWMFLEDPRALKSWEKKMRELQDSAGMNNNMYNAGSPQGGIKQGEFGEYEGPDLSERGKETQKTLYKILVNLVLCCCFVNYACQYGFITALSLLIQRRHGFGAAELGYILMAFSAAKITCQLVGFSAFLPRGGKHVCAVIGYVMMSIGIFFVSYPNNFQTECAIMLVIACGCAFTTPANVTLLNRYAPANERESVQMRGEMANLLGMFIGPIAFAALHQANRKKHTDATPFYVCGATVLIALILMIVVIQENAMLPEHKEHEDEPNTELLRVVRLGRVIGWCVIAPLQVTRSVVAIYLMISEWNIEGGCQGILFQVYVSFCAASVILICFPYILLIWAFFASIAGLVAINFVPGGKKNSYKSLNCRDTMWELYLNIDLTCVYGIVCFYYMFFVSAFRRTEDVTTRVVRMTTMPVNLCRVVIGMLVTLYYYKTKMQPGNNCSTDDVSQDWYKNYILISMFTFIFTLHPCLLHFWHSFKTIVGLIALTTFRGCDNSDLWFYVAIDVAITLTINALFYSIEVSVRFANLRPQTPQEHAKFVAGHAIGIPVALARVLTGYLQCVSDWGWKAPPEGCSGQNMDHLYMYKMYVVFAILSFLPVVSTKVFGLYNLLLAGLGIITLVYFDGCGRWRLFVEVDMFACIGGAGISYFIWVFVLDHPAVQEAAKPVDYEAYTGRRRREDHSSTPVGGEGHFEHYDNDYDENHNRFESPPPARSVRGSPRRGRAGSRDEEEFISTRRSSIESRVGNSKGGINPYTGHRGGDAYTGQDSHLPIPDDEKGDFQAAGKFDGPKNGYHFKMGGRGLGYYEDTDHIGIDVQDDQSSRNAMRQPPVSSDNLEGILKRSDIHGPGSVGGDDHHESDAHAYIYGASNGARQRNSRTGGAGNARLDI